MNRRDWLKRTALLAAGTIAVDQLELLDRLGWTRTVFPSVALEPITEYNAGFWITHEMMEDAAYSDFIHLLGTMHLGGKGDLKATYHFDTDSYLITPCNKEAPCTKTTR